MSVKPYIALAKLWLLLLLVSNTAVAGNTASTQDLASKPVTIFDASETLHKNMLQPQAMSLRVLSEHTIKPISFGDFVFPATPISATTYQFTKPTVAFSQDADRCESVSRLLFPFHVFW